MKKYFPRDLCCNLSTAYQNNLMELALFLGEKISKKIIECKITLVSANAASMESVQKEVQAHACACMARPLTRAHLSRPGPPVDGP